MSYFVYIIECKGGTFYTGITTDIQRRLKQHNGDLPGGAAYTRARRPVKLRYSKRYVNRSKALKEEYQIKQLTRNEKSEMIKKPRK